MCDHAFAAVPVVLIADEVALLVARLDDDDAGAADDDDRNAVAAVARAVAGKYEVALGKLLAQVGGDPLGETAAGIGAELERVGPRRPGPGNSVTLVLPRSY